MKNPNYFDFEKMMTLLPGHVYWLDKNNVYQGCNEQMAKSAGLNSHKEIVGKRNRDLPWNAHHPEFAEALDKVNSEIMETGIPQILEEPGIICNYGKATFLSYKIPLRDEHQKVIGLLGLSIDISVQKKREENLEAQKKQAETENKLKTEFIHNMEHDVRTPLGGIFGMTKIMAAYEKDFEKKQQLIDVSTCAKELLDYCNDILDYSNIEAGTFPVVSERFNLPSLINAVMAMESPAAQLKQLKLSSDIDPEIPTFIIGDSHRVQRILVNLISNAIKFTEVGFVRLHIKIAERTDRKIVLQFIVEDSGMGLSEEKQKIIFEKLSHIDASNKNLRRGKGIGLRIVNVFMSELDGDIRIESEVGKGTAFTCDIPFKVPLTMSASVGNYSPSA